MINETVKLQFELEQRIYHCWNLVDDIKVVTEALGANELDEPGALAVLNGLAEFYSLKFLGLQRTFEQYLASQQPKQDNDAY